MKVVACVSMMCALWYSVLFSYDAVLLLCFFCFFFFQAEDGIRDLVRSRGLGDVYKRQEGGCEHSRDRCATDQEGRCREPRNDRPHPGDALDLSLIHI